MVYVRFTNTSTLTLTKRLVNMTAAPAAPPFTRGRHSLACRCLLLSLLSLFLVSSSSGAEIYIDSMNGNDDSVDDSNRHHDRQSPLRTAQHGINKANDGDDIILLNTNASGVFTGGELCVQNIITHDGSFEDMAPSFSAWNLTGGASVVHSAQLSHTGEKALRLRPSSDIGTSSNTTASATISFRMQSTLRYRVRGWSQSRLAEGSASEDAPPISDDICGYISLVTTTATGAVDGLPAVINISCSTQLGWQYHEVWITPQKEKEEDESSSSSSSTSSTLYANLTVMLATNTVASSSFTLYVDDLSVVPFPSKDASGLPLPITFDAPIVIEGEEEDAKNNCEHRLPLSGVVGHVDGARVKNRFCDMHLDGGGWELFAADGEGNESTKSDHRVQLYGGSSGSGIGEIAEGATMVSLVSSSSSSSSSSLLYKKSGAYFDTGQGSQLREILIVIRRGDDHGDSAAPPLRWIKVKRSSGEILSSATLFNDVPKVPKEGETWEVTTDTGGTLKHFSDCRSTNFDGVPVANHLLRCGGFWKHLSTYTAIKRSWKCDFVNRVFKQTGVSTTEECFELCLLTPKCRFFTHLDRDNHFCVGCSVPSFIKQPNDSNDLMSYSVRTPFDPPLIGLASASNVGNHSDEVWSKLFERPDDNHTQNLLNGPLPSGAKVDVDVLVQGTGRLRFTYLGCPGGSDNVNVAVVDIDQDENPLSPPTWKTATVTISGESCG